MRRRVIQQTTSQQVNGQINEWDVEQTEQQNDLLFISGQKSTTKSGSRRLENSLWMMMMTMTAASLIWAGAVKKKRSSGKAEDALSCIKQLTISTE